MSPSTRSLISALHLRYLQGEPVRILMVCLGNICRSPAAEGVLRAVVDARSKNPAQWVIDSAGTGNYHIGDLPDSRMRRAAAARGLRLVHRCRQVCTDDFLDFDLIIGMDAMNLRNLRLMAPSPEAERKVVAMSQFFSPGEAADYVPDPYYEGAEGFELVLDLLDDACSNLYEAIVQQ